MLNEQQEQDSCSCTIIHEEAVTRVRRKMPDAAELFELSDFFKVFGDSTRIRILWALTEEELCVCDIAALLNATQSAVSHQLRVLKQARLVKHRKDGKIVYYSLDDEHIRLILDQGLTHIKE